MHLFPRTLTFAALLVGLAGQPCLNAADASAAIGITPIKLEQGAINNIFIARGVITSIRLKTKRPVDRIMLGSPIASVKHDEELNSIDIVPAPTVARGSTNMIVTIAGIDYVFGLTVTGDMSKVAYTKTYTLSDFSTDGNAEEDMTILGSAPRLKPYQIDTDLRIKNIERAEKDPVYRASLDGFRIFSLNKPYIWNSSVVRLEAVYAFLKEDLIVAKVQWINTSGYGLRLAAQQLYLKVMNTRFYPDATMQATDYANYWVMPGQQDTCYLFFAGKRLFYQNQFELVLPMDADAAEREAARLKRGS